MLRNIKAALLMALICAGPSAFAQPLAQAERKLCRELQIINSFAEAYLGPIHNLGAYDSISHYDSVFGTALSQLTAESPASLHYPFTRLRNLGVSIATSPDKRFRIYSWDGQTGGTAHNANNVFQYKINGKVYSTLNIVDGGPGDRYSAIYCLKTGDKAYYLAVSDAIIETLRGHGTLEILRLSDSGVERSVPLIQTASGTTGSLGFDYHLGADAEPDFHFDPATGQITFPVVLPGGQVTRRKITYIFNGKYFVRTSNGGYN
jgi:hypothetical protein